METTCGCETKASAIANGNTITSVAIALSKSMQWILVMQLLEDAFLRLSILQNKSYPLFSFGTPASGVSGGKIDPMPLLMGRFCRVSHLGF